MPRKRTAWRQEVKSSTAVASTNAQVINLEMTFNTATVTYRYSQTWKLGLGKDTKHEAITECFKADKARAVRFLNVFYKQKHWRIVILKINFISAFAWFSFLVCLCMFNEVTKYLYNTYF